MNAVAFLFVLRPSAWVGPRRLGLPAWRLGAWAGQLLHLRLCLPSEPRFGRIPLWVSRYFLDILLPLLFSALTRELFNEEIFVSQLRFFFSSSCSFGCAFRVFIASLGENVACVMLTVWNLLSFSSWPNT